MRCVRNMILGLALSLPAIVAWASGLDEVTVMALSPIDGRAVVKLADGRMQVVNTGDAIEGVEATVEQVLNDKLVVEETVEKGGDRKRITVWIHKAENGRSRVQRLDKQAPPQSLEMHQTKTLEQ